MESQYAMWVWNESKNCWYCVQELLSKVNEASKRLQSCWGSKLCHVRHSPHSMSSSLLSLSRGLSLPTSFHRSFSWRWSWKVSETCLQHILSLYLIYDLTASKYQSYLNCHRHKHDNLQKKHLSRLRASHPTTDISFIQSGQFARGRNLKSTTNICLLAIFKMPHLPWCHTRNLPQSNPPVELPIHQFVAVTVE